MVMLVAYLSSFGHVPWPICCNKLTTDRTNRVTSTNPLETPMYIQIGQVSSKIVKAFAWRIEKQQIKVNLWCVTQCFQLQLQE